MRNRKNVFQWLIFSLIMYIGFSIYQFSAASKATPVLQVIYGTGKNSVGIISQLGIPNKGYLHAAVSTDVSGNFYIITKKQNIKLNVLNVPASIALKDVAGYRETQKEVVHVLVANANGGIDHVIPLKRLDGRLARGHCEFLAVSASGKRWWTLRQAGESPEDWKDYSVVGKRTVLLNAYDNHGKPLAEWKVPLPLASETFALAATDTEAYVVPEILEQEKQLLVYHLGRQQPQKRPWPGSWVPAIAGSLITANEQFWHLEPHPDGSVESYITTMGKPSRLFNTFQWHRKGSYPFLFWADEKEGFFVFENLKDNKGNIRFSDGAKAVYRIAPNGTVHKLFETPDVLQAKPAEQVRAGQLLKADENFVWMEVSYLKNDKATEYQIVKVPIP